MIDMELLDRTKSRAQVRAARKQKQHAGLGGLSA